MGAITPVGIGVDEYWSELIAGKSGVRYISRFDTDGLAVRIAAEVADFHPGDFMERRHAKLDPFSQYALAAAREALQNLRIDNPERTGIIVGSSVGGIATLANLQERLTKTGSHRVSPYFMSSILSNLTASYIAIAHGLKGPSLTICTACSAGADAIGLAADKLKTNEADMMIAVGAESILCPIVIDGLSSARALSTYEGDPAGASRPFDLHRDGFVIGEGAGAVVLETLTHARKRDAEIQAELIGYANLGSGYHITAPEPDGRGEILCMQKALANAGIDPGDIDYINAHGTSTPVGDPIETRAVKTVFGDRSAQIPMSSTKGATGHLLGAGGITEIIACIRTINEGVLPHTINLENPDPECDLDYVPNKARRASVDTAMSNSFGFGGQNATLIVRRFA